MQKILRMMGLVVIVVTPALAAAPASSFATPLFEWSETGTLHGVQTESQVFTTVSGKQVICSSAVTTGTISTLEREMQEVEVEYSGCKAFGFAAASVSKARYKFHANGAVDLLNEVTINVPLGFCHVTVKPQSGLGSVSYANIPPGDITESSNVTGLTEVSSSSLCGPSSAEGIYTGSNVVHLNSGPPTSTIGWTSGR